MYRIAIVEDTDFDARILEEHIHRYETESALSFELSRFKDGAEFLSAYNQPDIIFMDIAMNKLDGMKTARLLRRKDRDVILFFVTSMIQYAVQGYSVDAMDFIVKPVSYMALKTRLDRALAKLTHKGAKRIEIKNTDGSFQLRLSDICYIETFNHRVIIHTLDRALPVGMSMRSLEKELEGLPFFRCHTSFLINLDYVDKIRGNDVWVNGQLLSISRYRKNEFLAAWAAYLGDEA